MMSFIAFIVLQIIPCGTVWHSLFSNLYISDYII